MNGSNCGTKSMNLLVCNMKKTNVAFCLRDMQIGGVESVLIRTLDELSKRKDINIFVITYVDIHEDIYKKYFKEHPDITLCSLYPCRWFGTKLPHFFLWRLVAHFMRDVYHGFKRVFVLQKFKNIDVFIDYHDFCFAKELKHVKWAKKIAWFHSSLNVFIKRKFINQLKFYDKFVVLTDDCAKDLKSLYTNNGDKIIRIYNPIDIETIRNMANKEAVISGQYFCSVSRLSGDKDIKTLLNGFDLFYKKNKDSDVKLVLVGSGDKAEEYKKYANSLKSSKQIIFVGPQKNPFVYMKYAIGNILSSYGEGLPTVLIESAVVGTLNIASNCKYGPSEILLNGYGGMLFEPGNDAQLAKCMDDVYNKNVDIKKMVRKMEDSLDRFEPKKIVLEIISLFF